LLKYLLQTQLTPDDTVFPTAFYNLTRDRLIKELKEDVLRNYISKQICKKDFDGQLTKGKEYEIVHYFSTDSKLYYLVFENDRSEFLIPYLEEHF
jgi:hypothetical protein